MSSKFVLTAQLNLAPPTNTKAVIDSIRSELAGIKVPIDVNVSSTTTRGIESITKSIKHISKETTKAADAFQWFGHQIRIAVQRFAAFSIASFTFMKIISVIEDAKNAANDFNHEMIKISQVTGMSVSGLKGLSDEVTKLSTKMGVSSKSILNSAQVLAQAGLSIDKVKKSIEALALTELAPTFDNVNDTTEATVAIFSQFGDKAGELKEILGSINAISAKFAVESSDLTTVIRKAGGAFSAAGGSLNELLAMFTSVRATTRESADTIATGFRTIFSRLQRVKTVKFFENLGIELRDLNGQFVGPLQAIERIGEALKNVSSTDPRFAQVVEELGGFRQVSKVIPLLQQFEVTQKALSVATLGQTSLTEDAAKAQQSYLVQITKVREEFYAMIRTISNSDSFKSTVSLMLKAASAAIKLADAFSSVSSVFAVSAGLKLFPAFKKIAVGAAQNPTNKYAEGGLVPGSGNTDSVPAVLPSGSFVLRKSAVNKIGRRKVENIANAMVMPGEYIFSPKEAKEIGYGNLAKLNSLPKFADGGEKGFDTKKFLVNKVKDFSAFSGIDVEALIKNRRGKRVDEFIKLFSELPKHEQEAKRNNYGGYYGRTEIGINDLSGKVDEKWLSEIIYHELTHFIVDEYNSSIGVKRENTLKGNYARIYKTPAMDKLKTLVESAKSKYRAAGKKPHKEEFYNQFEPEEVLAYFTGQIGSNSQYYAEHEPTDKTVSGIFNRIRNIFSRGDVITTEDKSNVSDVFSVIKKQINKYRDSHKILTPFYDKNGEQIMKDANYASEFDLSYHKEMIDRRRKMGATRRKLEQQRKKANIDLMNKYGNFDLTSQFLSPTIPTGFSFGGEQTKLLGYSSTKNYPKEDELSSSIKASMLANSNQTEVNNQRLRIQSVLSKTQKQRKQMGWEDAPLLAQARRLGIDTTNKDYQKIYGQRRNRLLKAISKRNERKKNLYGNFDFTSQFLTPEIPTGFTLPQSKPDEQLKIGYRPPDASVLETPTFQARVKEAIQKRYPGNGQSLDKISDMQSSIFNNVISSIEEGFDARGPNRPTFFNKNRTYEDYFLKNDIEGLTGDIFSHIENSDKNYGVYKFARQYRPQQKSDNVSSSIAAALSASTAHQQKVDEEARIRKLLTYSPEKLESMGWRTGELLLKARRMGIGNEDYNRLWRDRKEKLLYRDRVPRRIASINRNRLVSDNWETRLAFPNLSAEHWEQPPQKKKYIDEAAAIKSVVPAPSVANDELSQVRSLLGNVGVSEFIQGSSSRSVSSQMKGMPHATLFNRLLKKHKVEGLRSLLLSAGRSEPNSQDFVTPSMLAMYGHPANIKNVSVANSSLYPTNDVVIQREAAKTAAKVASTPDFSGANQHIRKITKRFEEYRKRLVAIGELDESATALSAYLKAKANPARYKGFVKTERYNKNIDELQALFGGDFSSSDVRELALLRRSSGLLAHRNFSKTKIARELRGQYGLRQSNDSIESQLSDIEKSLPPRRKLSDIERILYGYESIDLTKSPLYGGDGSYVRIPPGGGGGGGGGNVPPSGGGSNPPPGGSNPPPGGSNPPPGGSNPPPGGRNPPQRNSRTRLFQSQEESFFQNIRVPDRNGIALLIPATLMLAEQFKDFGEQTRRVIEAVTKLGVTFFAFNSLAKSSVGFTYSQERLSAARTTVRTSSKARNKINNVLDTYNSRMEEIEAGLRPGVELNKDTFDRITTLKREKEALKSRNKVNTASNRRRMNELAAPGELLYGYGTKKKYTRDLDKYFQKYEEKQYIESRINRKNKAGLIQRYGSVANAQSRLTALTGFLSGNNRRRITFGQQEYDSMVEYRRLAEENRIAGLTKAQVVAERRRVRQELLSFGANTKSGYTNYTQAYSDKNRIEAGRTKATEKLNRVISLQDSAQKYLDDERRASNIASAVGVLSAGATTFGSIYAKRGYDKIAETGGVSGQSEASLGTALSYAGTGAAFGNAIGNIVPGIGPIVGTIIGAGGGIAYSLINAKEEIQNAVNKARFDVVFKELSETIEDVSSKKRGGISNIGNVTYKVNEALTLMRNSTGDARLDIKGQLQGQSVALEGTIAATMTELSRGGSGVVDSFAKLENIVGTDLIESFASITGLPLTKVEEKFKKLAVEINKNIIIQKKIESAGAKLEIYFNRLASLDVAFNDTNSQLSLFTNRINSLIEGTASYDNVLGDLTKASELSYRMFNSLAAASDNLSAISGTGISSANARAAYELEKKLPEILARSLSLGNLSGEMSLTQSIQSQVESLGVGQQVANAVTTAVGKLLGADNKEENLIEKLSGAGGPEAVAKEISGELRRFYEPLQTQIANFENLTKVLAENTRKRIELEAKLVASMNDEVKLREEAYDVISSALQTSSINKAAAKQAFNNERQRNILGPRLAGAFNNPAMLGQVVASAQAQISALQNQYQVGGKNPAIQSKIGDLESVLARAREGLDFLKDPANSAAVSLAKLASSTQRANDAFEVAATRTFGSFEEVFKLEQTISDVKLAAKTGSISSIPKSRRGALQSYLRGNQEEEFITGRGSLVTGKDLERLLVSGNRENYSAGKLQYEYQKELIKANSSGLFGAEADALARKNAEQNLKGNAVGTGRADIFSSIQEYIQASKIAQDAQSEITKNFDNNLTTLLGGLGNLFNNFIGELNQAYRDDLRRKVEFEERKLKSQYDVSKSKRDLVTGFAQSAGFSLSENDLLDTQMKINELIKNRDILSKVNPQRISDLSKIQDLSYLGQNQLIEQYGLYLTPKINDVGRFGKGVVSEKNFSVAAKDVAEKLGNFKGLSKQMVDELAKNLTLEFKNSATEGKISFGEIADITESLLGKYSAEFTPTEKSLSELRRRTGLSQNQIISTLSSGQFRNVAAQFGKGVSFEDIGADIRNAELALTSVRGTINELNTVPNFVRQNTQVQPSVFLNNGNVEQAAVVNRRQADFENLPGKFDAIINNMSNSITLFNAASGGLALAMNNFPRELSVNARHTVEVVVNGAQVLNQIMPEIGQLVEESTKQAINKMLKAKFPQVGPMQ